MKMIPKPLGIKWLYTGWHAIKINHSITRMVIAVRVLSMGQIGQFEN